MESKFLFILICFYNEDEVVAFIRKELGKQSLKEIDILIVNNGTEHLSTLQNACNSNVMLTGSGKNLGYFGGAAFGLQEYKRIKGGVPPFTIISNTDIKLAYSDFLKGFYRKHVGSIHDVLGPDIHSSLNGQHQNPYIPERISREKMEFFRKISASAFRYNAFLLLYYGRNKIRGLLQRKVDQSYKTPRETYSIHGSFMVFKKSFFEKGGNFSYGSFLYGEEIFVGEQAKTLGMSVYYEAQFKVIHKEHATTGIFKKARDVKFMHDSYRHILEKYY